MNALILQRCWLGDRILTKYKRVDRGNSSPIVVAGRHEICRTKIELAYKAKIAFEGRYVTKRCHLHPRYAMTQRAKSYVEALASAKIMRANVLVLLLPVTLV